MYFVSVESLDSCHSTSRGVNCVYFVSVESLDSCHSTSR